MTSKRERARVAIRKFIETRMPTDDAIELSRLIADYTVAVALNAIPRPHPTDPTIIQYERNGSSPGTASPCCGNARRHDE